MSWLDADGDGEISSDELAALDIDGDGKISKVLKEQIDKNAFP